MVNTLANLTINLSELGDRDRLDDSVLSHPQRRQAGVSRNGKTWTRQRFLVEQGIDSISLNPDSVVKTRLEIAKAEAES